MIELRNITVRYPGEGSRLVLNDVSLCVPPRKTVVLLGGSGAGKSTIFKAILRLIPVESGTVSIDGTDTRTFDNLAIRRRIGMVFQGIALFPHLTVAENIGLTLRLAGEKKNAVKERVHELLHLVSLAPELYADRYPAHLSGGEQQRVGVARALATRPRYLLMDEPFGALDAITRRNLQEELKILRRRLDITILFVTHDIMEAVSLGDSIAVMDQGRILQQGTIRDVMEHPRNDIVRKLVTTPLEELETFVKDSLQ